MFLITFDKHVRCSDQHTHSLNRSVENTRMEKGIKGSCGKRSFGAIRRLKRHERNTTEKIIQIESYRNTRRMHSAAWAFVATASHITNYVRRLGSRRVINVACAQPEPMLKRQRTTSRAWTKTIRTTNNNNRNDTSNTQALSTLHYNDGSSSVCCW